MKGLRHGNIRGDPRTLIEHVAGKLGLHESFYQQVGLVSRNSQLKNVDSSRMKLPFRFLVSLFKGFHGFQAYDRAIHEFSTLFKPNVVVSIL